MKNRGKNIGLLLTGMAVGAALRRRLCRGDRGSTHLAAHLRGWTAGGDGGVQHQRQQLCQAPGHRKGGGLQRLLAGRRQVDSDADYTGEPPSAPGISSVKGTTLAPGERSGLIISGGGAGCVVTSSNPKVASVEKVSGSWVVEAHAEGTATLTAKDAGGGPVLSPSRFQVVTVGELTKQPQMWT